MKKNFLSTMGKTLVIALIGMSLVTITGCNKNTDEPVTPDPDPTPSVTDTWAHLVNETAYEAQVDGNTLRYGDHEYSVIGEIDLDATTFQTATASVTFTNVPSGYTEFEAVYNGLLGKSMQGTAAMIPMAMEIYARDAATGERCFNLLCKGSATVSELIRILKTKFNYSPYSPEIDPYVQRYLPAVTLKGAAYNNGYNPTEPYTVEMCRSANAPATYSFDAYGMVYYLYILAPGGWDTPQRGVDIFKADNSDFYKVFQCPALYTQCKITNGDVWNGLK